MIEWYFAHAGTGFAAYAAPVFVALFVGRAVTRGAKDGFKKDDASA